jgi:uncharacterized protein (DUF3084 family)
MSDTPETDAHSPASYAIIRPDGVRTDYVPADFARKLERERDEAREAFAIATINCTDAQQRLREMEDQRDFAMSEMERLKQERDEERRLLAAAKESLNAIHVEVGGWIAAMMKGGK